MFPGRYFMRTGGPCSIMNEPHPVPGSRRPAGPAGRKMVVIATYNEGETIRPLVSRVLSREDGFSVLVVDDNSPDGTSDIVRNAFPGDHRVRVVTRSGKKGYADAMMRGFREALNWDAGRIFTMDADLSHNPDDLSRLDSTLDNHPLAIGSRYSNGIRILNWSPMRLLLSLAANTYVSKLLNLPYSDCTSGFRAYRREVVEKIISTRVKSNGYAFLVEVLAVVYRAGWRAKEVPIIYTERRAGQSKMSRLVIVEAFFLPWRLLLRPGRRNSPRDSVGS